MRYTIKLKCRKPFNNWEEVQDFDCDPNLLGRRIRHVAAQFPACDIWVYDADKNVCCTVRVKAIGFNMFRSREMTMNGNRRYMRL
jgi:hypothetical protein